MKIDVIAVSFVLPCLNERNTIAKCVFRAREAAALIEDQLGLKAEIIVADNGSTDGSQTLAAEAGARVVAVDRPGYGAALIGGFSAAQGRFLVMGDSDCSYDFVEAVPMVEELVKGHDLCMGSRFRGVIKPGSMPWKNRYIGNPALTGILRFLFKSSITDAHCGLRALRRSAFDQLKLTSSGMEFASEMVLKAALLGLRVSEVPVTLSPDQRGREPHLKPWRDGVRHLFYMLMLCPTWLFVAPAAAMAAFGVTILGFLVAGADGKMVRFWGLAIGDHWAVIASLALVLSVQVLCFGLAALITSYRDGVRRPSTFWLKVLSHSNLRSWMIAGGLVFAVGFGWATSIALGWIESGYGDLSAMRSLIGASTAMCIGVQLMFCGFLLSIISGNELRHGLAAYEN